MINDQQLKGLRVGFVVASVGQLLVAALQRTIDEVLGGRGTSANNYTLGTQHRLAIDADAQLPCLASHVQGGTVDKVTLTDGIYG